MEPKKDKSGFDELWAAWGRKEKRADASAAYKTIAPDAATHRTLVDTATAWTSSYTANQTEKRYQKYLHNWLKGECWLEDLPVAFENYKDAAKSRKKERVIAMTDNSEPSLETTFGASGLTLGTPLGRHVVEIVRCDVHPITEMGGETALSFEYRIKGGNHEGKVFGHRFMYASNDSDLQEAGQITFRDIRTATNIEDPRDTSELHGSVLAAIVSSCGRIKYEGLHQ